MLGSKHTLVFDFDNTLYDWVEQWYQSFSAMLLELVRLSGIPETTLKAEIRKVFQRHHTTEYSFVIEEIPALQAAGHSNVSKVFAPAIQAYQSARDEHLKLYDGVMDTLLELKRQGKVLVLFTESQTFYSMMRIKRFGLDGIIDYMYTSEDSEDGTADLIQRSRSHPASRYQLTATIHKSIRFGHLKPDPDILLQIISETGAATDSTLYIGDSLFKDILMGNQAGVTTAWAKYGQAQTRPEYNVLREVSHWSDEDIAREKALGAQDTTPDITLNSITDLLALGRHA